MKLLVYPDTNCWRGELASLSELRSLKNHGGCRIACSYTVAKECATAETIGLSRAALGRILDLSDTWLRGRDDILKGIVGYVNNGCYDEISVEMLPYAARQESRFWHTQYQSLSDEHLPQRIFKEAFQRERVLDAQVATSEFLAAAGGSGPMSDEDVARWLFRCLDPSDPKWGGILLNEALGQRGLPVDRIHEVLRRLNQFPGLKLSHGHFIYRILQYIRGCRVDKSVRQDSLILLPMSSSCCFVTVDRHIHQTAKVLGVNDLVLTPTQAITRLKSGCRTDTPLPLVPLA